MRPRPEQVTACSGAAALALGALGMAFERADPSVMAAPPEELTTWASRHHRALTAQSVVYLAGAAPLLAFFASLSRSLRPEDGVAPLVRSAAVLAGGSTWLGFQAAAQVEQLALAREAAHGAPPRVVAARGSRMRELLRYGNAALAGAPAATATASGNEPLPRWLRRLSAAAAVAQVAPLVAGRRGRGVVETLPYPFFVAWLVGVVGVTARRSRGAAAG